MMNREEKKKKVLDMLKDQVITQAQALDLLELIAHETTEKKTSEPEPLAREVEITPPNLPFDFFGQSDYRFSFSEPVRKSQTAELRVIGKNSQINVMTHQKSTIDIKGWYKATRNNNPMITFVEQDNVYVLNYNVHGVKHLGCDIYVPEEMLGLIYIENSNAPVDLRGIEAKEIGVLTKNAPISIRGCISERLIAATKNSDVTVKQVQSKVLDVTTTNAKIVVNDTFAFEGEFKTSNAMIFLQDSGITKSYYETKNANLWIDLTTIDLRGRYEIEGRTTNANIEVLLPDQQDVSYQISGATKRGAIITDRSDLRIRARDKGYLVAKTYDYDTSPSSVNLNLQTTNANIKITETFY